MKICLLFLIARFLNYFSVCCVCSPIYSSFTVVELQTSSFVPFYPMQLKNRCTRLRKQNPILLGKNRGQFSSTFGSEPQFGLKIILVIVRIFHTYISKRSDSLKIQISNQNLQGHSPPRILNPIDFWNLITCVHIY